MAGSKPSFVLVNQRLLFSPRIVARNSRKEKNNCIRQRSARLHRVAHRIFSPVLQLSSWECMLGIDGMILTSVFFTINEAIKNTLYDTFCKCNKKKRKTY